MEKQEIYKYKAHLQVNNLFFKNIDNFDNYSEKELEDLYFQVKEFLMYVHRSDKTMYQEQLPVIFKEQEVKDFNDIKFAFNEIKENASKYIEFEKDLNKELKEKINIEFKNRNFLGAFPKYYLEKEDHTLVVEYDDDIYLTSDKLVCRRNAVVVKIPNDLVTSLNIDLNTFTHEDLVLKYNNELMERKIKAFLIHLPNLDYSVTISEEEITRDLKYFEIIDSVLGGIKYLPKWYIEYNKSSKDFSKTYLLLLLLIGIPTLIALTALFSLKGPVIAISLIGYFAVSYYISIKLGERKYNKVQKK